MICPQKKRAWSLAFITHALLAKKIDEEMQAAGVVSLDVYDVLLNLEMAPNQKLKMCALAEAVLLSRSGLTRLIDRLEEQGFIEREGCKCDRRSTHAILTSLGQSERERAWPIFEFQIEKLFATYLEPGDEETLNAIYARILNGLARTCKAS